MRLGRRKESGKEVKSQETKGHFSFLPYVV